MSTQWSACSGRTHSLGHRHAQSRHNAGGVREYFNRAIGSRKPNEQKATPLETSALVVSDSVVLISGLWQVERIVDDKPRLTPLRISIAVTKRGNSWRIAQFHNSARPVQ